MNAPGGELQMSACSIMQRASSTEDETCWASAGSCSSTSMKVNLYLGQGFQASTCSASRAAWSPDDLNAPPKFRPSAAAPEPSQPTLDLDAQARGANEQLAAAIVTGSEATCAAGTDTVAACHKHGQAKWQSSQSSATGTPWDGRVHH